MVLLSATVVVLQGRSQDLEGGVSNGKVCGGGGQWTCGFYGGLGACIPINILENGLSQVVSDGFWHVKGKLSEILNQRMNF